MASKTNISLSLQGSLNRAIVYTAFPTGKAVNYTIYHHKKTSALQFDVDSKATPIKTGEVAINMYRNLEKCSFASTFFNLENMKNDNYDYQCKFGGPNKEYEKHCYPFMKEKLDLQAGNSRDTSTNYLLVLGWKLFDVEDDLIFFFVQRRCYNTITRTNIIRTAGLQFATRKGIEVLGKYNFDSENSVKKIKSIPELFEDNN